MRLSIQLFGGRGVGSKIYSYRLPVNPSKSKKLVDVTHPLKKEKTKYRNYLDKENGLEIEYHPGQQNKNGWRGKSHYHVLNPNRTNNSDYYLDKDGNPCPKGSSRSHLEHGEYELLLRRIQNDK